MTRILLAVFLMSISTLSCNTFKYPDYIEFRNLSFENLGFSESLIKMELVYHNPNKFGFQVRKTEAEVYVDNVYLGKAISDTLIKVDKKSDFAIPIYIKTDMKNLFKNAWSAFTNKTVLVRATGTITAGVAGVFKTIPMNYEGRHEASLFVPAP